MSKSKHDQEKFDKQVIRMLVIAIILLTGAFVLNNLAETNRAQSMFQAMSFNSDAWVYHFWYMMQKTYGVVMLLLGMSASWKGLRAALPGYTNARRFLSGLSLAGIAVSIYLFIQTLPFLNGMWPFGNNEPAVDFGLLEQLSLSLNEPVTTSLQIFTALMVWMLAIPAWWIVRSKDRSSHRTVFQSTEDKSTKNRLELADIEEAPTPDEDSVYQEAES